MAGSSNHLRSLAHKLLNDTECAELKTAIQGFKKDKSVLLLCASLYKILTTPEKTQILLAVYPMIPKDMQADFDNLCCLQFDYYATHLRQKIMEKHEKKSKKGLFFNKATKDDKAPAMVSIEQLRRFHTPRDQPGRISPSRHQTGRISPLRHQTGRISPTRQPKLQKDKMSSRKSKEPRHRRSPEQSRRRLHGAQQQQQRKRSKTAHAVLGPAKVQSPRPLGKGPEPPRVPPEPRVHETRVPPVLRVPPLELDMSHNSSTSSMSTSQHSQQMTPKNKEIPIRKVKLESRRGQSLGFAIRGGSDLKSGIYVSEVDAGGQAERRGLRVGERILKVNDIPFKNVSHAEAVATLKASKKVTIYVAPIGLMPGSTPTGTPRTVNSGRTEEMVSARSHGESPRLKTPDVRKITVVADADNFLGCSIRGGIDCGIGVIVANVDPDSPAYRAGLKKGQLILKVNETPVKTLNHGQVIDLITASNIVVFEVKQGSREKQRSSRKQKLAPAAASSHPQDNKRDSTPPRGQYGEYLNQSDFEKELMSTPPVSTSTPLPPDDHPLLLANRQDNIPTFDDATILQLLQKRHSPCPSQENNDSGLEEPLPSSETEDQNKTLQNEQNFYGKESKFDKGTIKLNMAEKSEKEILKTAKIININIEPTSRAARRRSHVKDIFADNLSTTKRSESCRSPTRQPKSTPQRERANSMNILSTPHATRRRHQIEVTPPQHQLQDASSTAKMQIRHELTGKRLLLSPNVPVAPNSPVSNFFRKVLHTENASPKSTRRMGGSLESFGHGFGHDGKQSNVGIGMSKWRSAYDFVTESESDEE